MVKSTKRRRKSKRVRLAEAMRVAIDPLMFGRGYRNPKTMDWDRWVSTRRNIYIRYRGDCYEEVIIHWRTMGRPSFFIEFESSQIEREPEDGGGSRFHWLRARQHIWECRFFGQTWSFCQFGLFTSIARTVDLAAQRLKELDDHILAGTADIWMGLGRVCVADDPVAEPILHRLASDPWGPKSAEDRAAFPDTAVGLEAPSATTREPRLGSGALEVR